MFTCTPAARVCHLHVSGSHTLHGVCAADNMSSGETRTVELVVEPAWRVVITNETFVRTVEPRPVILWVGDGQPNLTEGSENLAHETAVVRLRGKSKPLDACELK